MSRPTPLSTRHSPERKVRELQRNLRQLGYLRRGIDGDFGAQTEFGVRAIRHDLLHNDGRGDDGQAPVAVREYNGERVREVNGEVDDGLQACIADLIAEPRFPKLPSAEDPATENRRTLERIDNLELTAVPKPFLLAMLRQESNLQHYRVPRGSDGDNFVTVGLDQGDGNVPAVTSRGYGLGQYTLFHHPPTETEVRELIVDPVRNLDRAIQELRDKFDRFIVSDDAATRADDRIAEHGHADLRDCKYEPNEPGYMTNCRECLREIERHDIVMGTTPWYEGSGRVYENTDLYRPDGGRYRDVPIRSAIPCDWPYATRRYNGSGQYSYHYQAIALQRVAETS